MANPERTFPIIAAQSEVVEGQSVELQPTQGFERPIDFPPDFNTPIFPFRTKEGDSFRFGNALRFRLNRIQDQYLAQLGIELLCQDEAEDCGLLPIFVRNGVVNFGNSARLRLTGLFPWKQKALFFIALRRDIKLVDEFKERQEASYKLDGQEGAF